MNHYVGHGGTSSYTQGVDIDVLEGLWLFHRIATIKEPSSILVFIDTFEDSINHRLFVIDARPEGIVLGWNHVPVARHGRTGTLSFADGHVEGKKWLDPRTIIKNQHKPLIFTNQPNNVDVAWLASRATFPAHPAN
jgi:prepilin-type processing-associated H-X9-DG protein